RCLLALLLSSRACSALVCGLPRSTLFPYTTLFRSLIARWGTHPSWSRLLGSPRPYVEIEERLTELLQAPDTLVLPTITHIHMTVDRKSTRLNSSHGSISYAVFCLKKKNIHLILTQT